MKSIIRIAALATLAASCSRQPERKQPQVSAPEPPVPPPGTGPDARTPLAQPAAQKPTIDPKSTEAAEELTRNFVRLLNAGKFDEAYMLLGPGAPPRRQFDRNFSELSNLNVSQGAAGDQEGAAGSAYLSVPLSVSGTRDGKRVSHSATAILRRVNDVPGSTEAQRHWHIERIDWGDTA
jgi:hypothetical protein